MQTALLRLVVSAASSFGCRGSVVQNLHYLESRDGYPDTLRLDW